eukprot:14346231-Alexandrium_andersonii.AAC.1
MTGPKQPPIADLCCLQGSFAARWSRAWPVCARHGGLCQEHGARSGGCLGEKDCLAAAMPALHWPVPYRCSC